MGRIAYRVVDLDDDRAEEECRRVVREPFAHSAVATRRPPGGPERIVGVVNGVLLREGFARAVLRSETPYFHNRVRDARDRPFPDAREVGLANAGEGQEMFLAHVAFDPSLSDDEFVRARLLLASRFAEGFAGNRVRGILVETVGRENTVMATSGGFEVVTNYPAWRRAHGVEERDGPYLLRIDLEGAMAAQTLHLARLLHYRPPRFRFPSGGRELLRLAAQGLADAQIAELPGMSAASVASGWTRLLRHALRAVPDLAAAYPPSVKSRERLALLAYVRDHPEELWPYGPG